MTPKQTATDFLIAWASDDYVRMLQLTQLTWKAELIKKPSIWERIKDWATGRSSIYDFNNSLAVKTAQFDVSAFNIESIGEDENLNSAVAKKVQATLTLSGGDSCNVSFLMVCEKGAHAPDPEGKWGVNPTSIQFSGQWN